MPVPWKQIIDWTPQIISLSRELLNRARKSRPSESPVRVADPTDLDARLSALEENERRQAELVNSMAEQIAQLSRAVTALHRRQRWLIGAVVLLAGVLLWKLLQG